MSRSFRGSYSMSTMAVGAILRQRARGFSVRSQPTSTGTSINFNLNFNINQSTKSVVPARNCIRERQGFRFIDPASDSAGEHMSGKGAEFAERKYGIRQRRLSRGGRKYEIAIERGVYRVARARQAALGHHGTTLDLCLGELGVRGAHRKRRVFAQGAFAAKCQSLVWHRRRPTEPAELLPPLERSCPKMRAIANGHAAGGVGSRKRTDRDAASRLCARRADATFEIDGCGAKSGAHAAKREVCRGTLGRIITEFAVGEITPPVLVASRQEIEQDCGRHDRNACITHLKTAALL